MNKIKLYKHTTCSNGVNAIIAKGGRAFVSQPIAAHTCFSEEFTGKELSYMYKVPVTLIKAIELVHPDTELKILLDASGGTAIRLMPADMYSSRQTLAIGLDGSLEVYDMSSLAGDIVRRATSEQLKEIFKMCVSNSEVCRVTDRPEPLTVEREVLHLGYLTGAVLVKKWLTDTLNKSEGDTEELFRNLSTDEWYDMVYRASPTAMSKLIRILLGDSFGRLDDEYMYIGNSTLLRLKLKIPPVGWDSLIK